MLIVGYFQLLRKIQLWEWYKVTNTKSVFIHLLLNANFETKSWQGIEIKRGQLLTSLNTLTDETGLSFQAVRTAIKNLKSTHDITIKSTNRNSMITICQYDYYNTLGIEINTPVNTPVNTPANNQSTRELTTTEELKNTKNLKNKEGGYQKSMKFLIENWPYAGQPKIAMIIGKLKGCHITDDQALAAIQHFIDTPDIQKFHNLSKVAFIHESIQSLFALSESAASSNQSKPPTTIEHVEFIGA